MIVAMKAKQFDASDVPRMNTHLCGQASIKYQIVS